ncbi:Peptidyl-prolyl cis-trans isomerase ppiD [Candidatus Methylocalor cossyra]|uniref:Periplasmic chaperone PpiD n=2 Tax=Candidatus Methylocalor cossyra TaxID=3108543 RepID=A0ABP1C9V3_9GAMM
MLILIGVPFALWGIQNYLDTAKETPVAVVEGREIFDRDVHRAYEQSLANLPGLAQAEEQRLKRETLEKLIMDEVIAQRAEATSLAVSDADVRSFIQSLPYFQSDGKFDREKYKVLLSAQGVAPAQFAAQVRRALLMEQYQRGILDSAFATKSQTEALLRLKNQEREIEYVKIPLKTSRQNIPEEEIQSYYREHGQDFRNPERIAVDYLVISLEQLAKDVQVTDQDLQRLYEEQKASFRTEERRRISHILVPIESSGNEAEKVALAKIGQIRERLSKGEDFAMVAKESSGDPVSAKQGGDLGLLEKKNLEEGFAKAAFSLPLNTVSEPVRTSYGYHLIKVTEIVPEKIKPFDEVKDELRKTAQHNAAENRYYEIGQILAEQAYEHPDSLEPAAKRLGLSVEHTNLFTRDQGEGLAAEPKIREAAFSEDVLKGRNSEPVELENDRAVVLRMREYQPASDKSLAEVRDTIVATLRREDARREARAQAQTLLSQVREGRSLADAARGIGLGVVKPAPLRRDSTTAPPAVVTAAFKAPRPEPGKPSFATVDLDSGESVVLGLLAVKDGSPAPEGKEAELARDFLGRALGQQEFAAFAARLRERADVQIKPES